jgi:hypothetical protein
MGIKWQILTTRHPGAGSSANDRAISDDGEAFDGAYVPATKGAVERAVGRDPEDLALAGERQRRVPRLAPPLWPSIANRARPMAQATIPATPGTGTARPLGDSGRFLGVRWPNLDHCLARPKAPRPPEPIGPSRCRARPLNKTAARASSLYRCLSRPSVWAQTSANSASVNP